MLLLWAAKDYILIQSSSHPQYVNQEERIIYCCICSWGKKIFICQFMHLLATESFCQWNKLSSFLYQYVRFRGSTNLKIFISITTRLTIDFWQKSGTCPDFNPGKAVQPWKISKKSSRINWIFGKFYSLLKSRRFWSKAECGLFVQKAGRSRWKVRWLTA